MVNGLYVKRQHSRILKGAVKNDAGRVIDFESDAVLIHIVVKDVSFIFPIVCFNRTLRSLTRHEVMSMVSVYVIHVENVKSPVSANGTMYGSSRYLL